MKKPRTWRTVVVLSLSLVAVGCGGDDSSGAAENAGAAGNGGTSKVDSAAETRDAGSAGGTSADQSTPDESQATMDSAREPEGGVSGPDVVADQYAPDALPDESARDAPLVEAGADVPQADAGGDRADPNDAAPADADASVEASADVAISDAGGSDSAVKDAVADAFGADAAASDAAASDAASITVSQVGWPTYFGSGADITSGTMFAYKIVTPAAAGNWTLDDLDIIVASTGGHARLALYQTEATNKPLALLASTTSISLVTGTNTATTAPIMLTASTSYWIVVVVDTTVSIGTSGPTDQARLCQKAIIAYSDPWPTTFGSSTCANTNAVNVFATLHR